MMMLSTEGLEYPYSKRLGDNTYVIFKQWNTEAGVWYMGVKIDLDRDIPDDTVQSFKLEFILDTRLMVSGAI